MSFDTDIPLNDEKISQGKPDIIKDLIRVEKTKEKNNNNLSNLLNKVANKKKINTGSKNNTFSKDNNQNTVGNQIKYIRKEKKYKLDTKGQISTAQYPGKQIIKEVTVQFFLSGNHPIDYGIQNIRFGDLISDSIGSEYKQKKLDIDLVDIQIVKANSDLCGTVANIYCENYPIYNKECIISKHSQRKMVFITIAPKEKIKHHHLMEKIPIKTIKTIPRMERATINEDIFKQLMLYKDSDSSLPFKENVDNYNTHLKNNYEFLKTNFKKFPKNGKEKVLEMMEIAKEINPNKVNEWSGEKFINKSFKKYTNTMTINDGQNTAYGKFATHSGFCKGKKRLYYDIITKGNPLVIDVNDHYKNLKLLQLILSQYGKSTSLGFVKFKLETENYSKRSDASDLYGIKYNKMPHCVTMKVRICLDVYFK